MRVFTFSDNEEGIEVEESVLDLFCDSYLYQLHHDSDYSSDEPIYIDHTSDQFDSIYEYMKTKKIVDVNSTNLETIKRLYDDILFYGLPIPDVWLESELVSAFQSFVNFITSQGGFVNVDAEIKSSNNFEMIFSKEISISFQNVHLKSKNLTTLINYLRIFNHFTLNKLELINCFRQDSDFEFLGKLANLNCVHLKILNLSRNTFSIYSMTLLCSLLQASSKTLTELYLDYCFPDADVINKFLLKIIYNTTLEVLSLKGANSVKCLTMCVNNYLIIPLFQHLSIFNIPITSCELDIFRFCEDLCDGFLPLLSILDLTSCPLFYENRHKTIVTVPRESKCTPKLVEYFSKDTCKHITRLILDHTNVPDSFFDLLVTNFYVDNIIEDIYISKAVLSPHSFFCLSEMYMKMSLLKHINLIHVSLDAEGIQYIYNYIHNTPSNNIETINLSNNNLDTSCCNIIFASLIHDECPHLTHLILDDCKISDISISYLNRFKLESSSLSLKVLSLANNGLRDESCIYLNEFLFSGTLQHIQNLNLANNHIRDKGLLNLLGGKNLGNLLFCDQLRSINLENNALSFNSCKHLMEFFSNCECDNNYNTLHINNNRIKDKGCNIISELISLPNIHIQCLYLQENSIGPDGMLYLYNSLLTHSVSILNLQDNEIQSDGGTLLCSLFEKHCFLELTELNISGCSIDEEQMKSLLSIITTETAPQLRSLYVTNNNISDAIISSFIDDMSETIPYLTIYN
ncbi:hypothetical protein WA158_001275 [Blastocystis sp. Blastoise]